MSNTKKRIASPNTQRNTAGKRKKANQNVIAFRTFQRNHKTEVEYLKVCSNCKTEFRTENKKVQTCCDTCQQSNKIRGYGQHEFYRTKIADNFNPSEYPERNQDVRKQPKIQHELHRFAYYSNHVQGEEEAILIILDMHGNYNIQKNTKAFEEQYEEMKNAYEDDPYGNIAISEGVFLVDKVQINSHNSIYYLDLHSNFEYQVYKAYSFNHGDKQALASHEIAGLRFDVYARPY